MKMRRLWPGARGWQSASGRNSALPAWSSRLRRRGSRIAALASPVTDSICGAFRAAVPRKLTRARSMSGQWSPAGPVFTSAVYSVALALSPAGERRPAASRWATQSSTRELGMSRTRLAHSGLCASLPGTSAGQGTAWMRVPLIVRNSAFVAFASGSTATPSTASTCTSMSWPVASSRRPRS